MASDSKTIDTDVAESLPKGLRSNEALHEPFGWYHSKRETAPVQYDPTREVYDVFSYEHVKGGLQDTETLVRPQLTQEDTDDPLSYFDTGMVWSNGSAHTQVKGELFQYFSPRMLTGIEDSIAAIANAQLETALTSGDEFDLVEDFAVPVPLRVIMDFIGIPQSDHGQLLEWLETFRSVMTSEDRAKSSVKEGDMAGAQEYFEQLVADRHANPQDDLVSQLATESTLTPTEIGSNCFDFALAGQGTMSELLTNAIYVFDQRGGFSSVDDFDLSVVLEEVLRYRSPLQARARQTTDQLTLGEVTIPPDEIVILWIGAANRDPTQFTDPDSFDPQRDPNHLAFGSGSHNCIGAPIARLEAPIILQTLFDRLGDVTIEYDHVVPKPKASKLGFDRMPVQLN